MTTAEVEARVRAIRVEAAKGRSTGVCHEMRDQLWAEVLAAIGDGSVDEGDAQGVALAAIATEGIEFPRWTE